MLQAEKIESQKNVTVDHTNKENWEREGPGNVRKDILHYLYILSQS